MAEPKKKASATAAKKTPPKTSPADKKPKTTAQASDTLPEWSNSTAIANLLGKTTRRVQQLTAEGVLETQVPPTGGKRKYKTCETIQRYIAHIEDKAKESGGEGKMAELTLKKLEAEIVLKESQGQMHQLKTAIQEGRYISADQAMEDLAGFMTDFKKFALSLPPRMANIMAAYTDAVAVRNMERDMRKEAEAMLASFVDAATPSKGDEL